ncbi:MAG TPA: heme biosynthesis protein HemY [Sedimenticola sp.]|nr:heme biosynthesis protein HemY [Sedimenticola sp.]
MKTLFSGLLLVAVAVFLALLLKQDNGYVLFSFGEWTVEASLALFLLVDLLLFLLLYLSLRLLTRVWGMPARLRRWRERRDARRARKALTRGLLALSEGQWKRAERELVRYAAASETPLINYLAAARAAQQQGADGRRDRYLGLARERVPAAAMAVGLTRAELQLEQEQLEQALDTLEQLREIAPRHPQVLRLLKEIYQRLGRWEALGRLLPVLKRRKVVPAEELRRLEREVYRSLLDQAALAGGTHQLSVAWRALPASAREDEGLVLLYAGYLQEQGADGQAEKLLLEALGHHWSAELVALYGRVQGSDGARQLSRAEAWLERHPRDPVLLLTLGRLCLRNRLWGKARSYLEASIGAGPSVEAYRDLGLLLQQIGEASRAMACFRAGLELSTGSPPPPLPTAPGGVVGLEREPAAGQGEPPQLETVVRQLP